MTKRQEFYLTKVLGFTKFDDDEFAKSDFIRIDKQDYVRVIAVKFFPDGKIEARVKYTRGYEDEDPTPIDPFVSDSVKKEDRYIAIFIVQTLKSEWINQEKGE